MTDLPWWPPATFDHDYDNRLINLSQLVEDTITSYIAGFVVKKVIKLINCTSCCDALTQSTGNRTSLISIKIREKLTSPSKDVQRVCHEAEKVISCYHSTYLTTTKNKTYLVNEIKSNVYKLNNRIFSDSGNQIPFLAFLHRHSSQLINLIILKYIDIRIFHEIRKINDNLHKNRKRAKLIKLIHFWHE